MVKKVDKNKDVDGVYQRAQEGVFNLGCLQKEKAASYLKKIEQKKIRELRESLSKK